VVVHDCVVSKTVRALERVVDPCEVLDVAGLDDGVLEPRHGWSNLAWVGDRYVVRVSSGRLAGSFEHERRMVGLLADSGIPLATVLASGRVDELPSQRDEAGEWIVSSRLPGDTLATLWPVIDDHSRAQVSHSVGEILRTLHELDIGDVAPQWWLDAHQPDQLRNAYRPRVTAAPAMIAAALDLPGADTALLAETEAMLTERLPLFDADTPVLIHGDIHGHNIMVTSDTEPSVSGILDWEGAHTAARDVELDMLLRWTAAAHDFPESPNRPSAIAPGDCVPLLEHIGAAYPDLFAGSHLTQRLEFYDALWHLVQLLFDSYWRSNNPTHTDDPSPAWQRLRALLNGQSHLRGLPL
jgi:hygromycin-B 7''-O-kinase